MTMSGGLLRPEDYLHTTAYGNYYWNQLLRTVDQFDQLMHIEHKEITKSIQELQQMRGKLARQFSQFKESLRLEGEVVKRELHVLEGGEIKKFFQGYHQKIGEVIEKVMLQPERVCSLLVSYPDAKRISFEDFLQNLVFNVYPCYLAQGRRTSLLMRYISSLLKQWPYDVELTRPRQYSLIDQALSACMKAPAIVCYVERIASRFLREASNVHMASFAFDNEAVQTQLHNKKQASSTVFAQEPKKSSWRNKLKSFFGKNKEEEQKKATSFVVEPKRMADEGMLDSFVELGQQVQTVEVMKRRQREFLDLVVSTITAILEEDVPLLLCQMLACFDAELTSRGAKGCRMKHYCYFLMTNLVLAELHNKFTISYQDSTMTHAHLQNISQIIKLLNCVMQGLPVQGEKYHQHAEKLNKYEDAVRAHYKFILQRGQAQADPDEPLLTQLLAHYQGSPVVSVGDLSVVIALLKHSKQPSESVLLDFLKVDRQGQMFEVGQKQRNIKYKHNSYSPQHIYLQHDSKHPQIKEVTDFYLTADQPLESLPLIRQLLIEQSNLPLQDALDIEQQCRVAQQVPMRELKGFIQRLAQRYPCLRLKDGRQLQLRFETAFRATLARSLQQKQWLLYYRSQLSQRLSRQTHMIKHFTDQLNSAQFYERMATAFILHPGIKVYLSIQNDLFVNHQSPQGLHRLQVTALMQRNRDAPIASNENFILRNSFKTFTMARDLVKCLGKNQITKAALYYGRRPDQFNQVFQELCEYMVKNLKQFLLEKKVLQSLSEQKLAQIVVRKIQDDILKRCQSQRQNQSLDKDKELLSSSTKVSKEHLWSRELGESGIDRDFLVAEGVGKFRAMMAEKNPGSRVRHLGELMKIFLVIMGFSMAKNKISAEVVNPAMQYVILCCAELPHHECLYSMETLRWRGLSQDSYNLTLYHSSLNYIRENMPEDYPL